MQGLGSDRTSITGVWEGVGSYFKREILTLVQRHCISHWLALAEKDSSTSAAYLEFFFFFYILDQVTCFYDNSTFWTAGLKEIQQKFDDLVFKISCAIDSCWLLKGKACSNLKKIF